MIWHRKTTSEAPGEPGAAASADIGTRQDKRAARKIRDLRSAWFAIIGTGNTAKRAYPSPVNYLVGLADLLHLGRQFERGSCPAWGRPHCEVNWANLRA